jgi:hypothetical protein
MLRHPNCPQNAGSPDPAGRAGTEATVSTINASARRTTSPAARSTSSFSASDNTETIPARTTASRSLTT